MHNKSSTAKPPINITTGFFHDNVSLDGITISTASIGLFILVTMDIVEYLEGQTRIVTGDFDGTLEKSTNPAIGFDDRLEAGLAEKFDRIGGGQHFDVFHRFCHAKHAAAVMEGNVSHLFRINALA